MIKKYFDTLSKVLKKYENCPLILWRVFLIERLYVLTVFIFCYLKSRLDESRPLDPTIADYTDIT